MKLALASSPSSTDRIANRPILFGVTTFYLVAAVAPLVAALVLSLHASDVVGLPESLDGYRAVFAGGRIAELEILARRAFVVTAIAGIIGVPAGFWLRQRVRGAVPWLVALIAPWLVSDLLRAFGWQMLLSPDGPISVAWQAIGGGPLEGLRYNGAAVIVALVSATLPAFILSVYAALPAGESSEWAAARELGAPRNVLTLMIGGRARIGVVFGACIVFLFSFFGSSEARFLDGPTQTSMQTIAASLANTGVMALLAWGVVLFGLAVGACALFGVILLIWQSNLISRGRHLTMFRLPAPVGGFLDAAARAVPVAAAALAVLLCCAPVAMIFIEAFRQPSADGGVWSVQNFILLLTSPDLVAALLRSVVIALIVALLASASAFLLSLSVWNTMLLRAVLVVVTALVLLPAEVYAISAIQVAKVFGITEANIGLLVLSHLVWTVPFACTGLILANRSISASVIESALEGGRRPASVAFGIVAAIDKSAIFGAFLLAFSLSLNEGTRTTYLGGALPSLGNQVYGRLQAGLLPENRSIFAVEALLIVLAVTAAAASLWALRDERRGTRL